MAAKAKKTEGSSEFSILKVTRGQVKVGVLGATPLILNAMSAKVRQQLLFPPKRKNTAERQTTLKHNPRVEFVDTMGGFNPPGNPTRIRVRSVNF